MYKTNVWDTSSKVVAAVFAAVAIMIALAVPAGATAVPPTDTICSNGVNCNTSTETTDKSKTNVVSGDCSAIQISGEQSNSSSSSANASSTAVGGNGAPAVIGVGGAGGDASSSSAASNSTSQTNVGNNFAADCSQHVTNVTNAAAQAQVKAVPSKGVNAGAGGAVASAVPSMAALAGSVVSFGLGALRLRKFSLSE